MRLSLTHPPTVILLTATVVFAALPQTKKYADVIIPRGSENMGKRIPTVSCSLPAEILHSLQDSSCLLHSLQDSGCLLH